MSRLRSAIVISSALFTAIPFASAITQVASAAVTGHIEERVLFDSTYHRERRVWVYTPPGYNPRAARPYPLIVAFDGDEYRDTLMPLPRILDSLLVADKAPAFVALLVDNGSSVQRIADLGNAERFAHFLGAQSSSPGFSTAGASPPIRTASSSPDRAPAVWALHSSPFDGRISSETCGRRAVRSGGERKGQTARHTNGSRGR